MKTKNDKHFRLCHFWHGKNNTMAELEIGTLIKIILGIIVVVAVVGGLYLVFKNQVIDFFKNIFSYVK